MTSASAESPVERILDAATLLFAEQGFAGTPTRLIAEAAGLNIATVNYHVGGKRDLYLAVMERAAERERLALGEAMEAFTADAEGVHRLADRYLDFCVAHPEIAALWLRRWLSEAEDIASLEAERVRPLIGRIVELAGQVAGPEVDAEYAVWSVVWCVHGFIRGGVLDERGRRRRGGDGAALRRFRLTLHRLVDGLLEL
ncbi:TetR/AcrR family transcriptional regulator [Actinocorallia populi]|uniref:TetR/AcrR family transcriptional regulator n=1 Tax=Actinocorallia populi TaxID=2079200 RepID=UPI0022B7E5B4|nr:TetR/AcrR family transcriptional regulator [Actinocorallia populi]